MTNLVPREPFMQDLFEFRRDFDQIFNRIMVGKPVWQENFGAEKSFEFLPSVEAYLDKEAKKYICRVSLPGVEPRDVEINLLGNKLTIKGERKFTHIAKEFDFLNEEIVYGKFERELELPEGVVPEKLVAEYHNGVLEITAPVTLAALPRKVKIKTLPLAKHVTA